MAVLASLWQQKQCWDCEGPHWAKRELSLRSHHSSSTLRAKPHHGPLTARQIFSDTSGPDKLFHREAEGLKDEMVRSSVSQRELWKRAGVSKRGKEPAEVVRLRVWSSTLECPGGRSKTCCRDYELSLEVSVLVLLGREIPSISCDWPPDSERKTNRGWIDGWLEDRWCIYEKNEKL